MIHDKKFLQSVSARATTLAAPSILRLGRHGTRDALTFDSGVTMHDAQGNMMGKRFEQGGRPVSYRMNDGATYDSTGAFLVGELERLDQKLHMPLATVSYLRDMPLRTDVTIADEVSSFTQSTFGSQGGLGTGNGVGNGKAWMGKNSSEIASLSLDIAKIPHPLMPWALDVNYTILELESAARLGRPVDTQKYDAMMLKHEMDADEQVYIGDLSLPGVTGLVNNSSVTNVSNFPNGAGGYSTWFSKTPDEILADINSAIVSTWTQSAYAVMPNRILIPPAQFGYISTKINSAAGGMSILKYLLENNVLTTSQGASLEIYPCKWCIGAGVGGTLGTAGTVDRMVVYNKDENFIRWPMTMLQRTPVQYLGLLHSTVYFCRFGVVEVVYSETLAYADGL